MGFKDLVGHLDRIDERIVNLERGSQMCATKQIRGDVKLAKIGLWFSSKGWL